MKRTYHNHDIEDYIDYHDIQYILHITNVKDAKVNSRKVRRAGKYLPEFFDL